MSLTPEQEHDMRVDDARYIARTNLSLDRRLLLDEIDRLRLDIAEKDKLIAELKARFQQEFDGNDALIVEAADQRRNREFLKDKCERLERDLTSAREEIERLKK